MSFKMKLLKAAGIVGLVFFSMIGIASLWIWTLILSPYLGFGIFGICMFCLLTWMVYDSI